MSQTHTVAVKFLQMSQSTSRSQIRVDYSKVYHYLTNRADLKPGDFVVVWSPIFNGPALCEVVEVMWNTKTSPAFKYIIDKVDFTDYNDRLAAEAAERERRILLQRQEAELRRTLAARRQVVEEAFIEQAMRGDLVYLEAEQELKRIQEALGN